MVHAVDMGVYYRIPADNRDLNYSKYFEAHDYNSHNTKQLNLTEIKEEFGVIA